MFAALENYARKIVQFMSTLSRHEELLELKCQYQSATFADLVNFKLELPLHAEAEPIPAT